MKEEEEMPIQYDPVTGLNRNGLTKSQSEECALNAQKSRELDPERGVWSQANITSEKLVERAQYARFRRDNGHAIESIRALKLGGMER